jgi:F-type H+-transporting ATPase subunit delta
VDVPSFSGAFGILPNHVPTLAVLKPGVLSVIESDNSVKKYFVSSGSITVNEDSSGIIAIGLILRSVYE